MKLELFLLIAVTLTTVISLIFVPKDRWLQAQFVFLFIQFFTWLLGLTVVELHLLEYPYRELSKANRTSFIFEYLILPVLCIHINTRFPQKASILKKFGIYGGTSFALTAVELVLEKYTDVIKYTGWEWYMSFFSVWFVLWWSRVATLWFFRKSRLAGN